MKRFVNNQKGFSIVIVLMLLALLMILGFAAISMANNQTRMVSIHQQREQALQYAEAGIHRYMAELSRDPNFYATTASSDMQDIDTVYEDGYFRISCSDPSIDNPYIILTSTGWHKNSEFKRTVEIKLQKKDLLQNAITTNTGSEVLWYTNRYIRGDRIYGPLHINGNLIVSGKVGDNFAGGEGGPRFYGKVTYSGNYIVEPGSWFAVDTTWYNPEYNTVDGAVKPEKVPATGMYSMNENLKLEADSDYIFQGRTCIYLNGTSMTIRNKNGSSVTKTIPENGIIYVKGNTGNNKWGLETANVFISGVLEGRLTIAAENDIYITAGDPTDWSQPSTTAPSTGGVTYSDLVGKTFTPENAESLMADCNDMLGLVANRNIRILHYNWPKGDGDYYWKRSLITHYDVAPYNINVHAAAAAVTGSFEYEEHRDGPKKGDVTIVGSIIQNRTGPLAGYSVNFADLDNFFDIPDPLHDRLSGYGRTFVHDPRMMYESPPSFAGPKHSGWEMVEWQEVSNPVVAEP